jgi:hypothetical protein
VFSYLADWYYILRSSKKGTETNGLFYSYGPYASSALAGQSLARTFRGLNHPYTYPNPLNKFRQRYGNSLSFIHNPNVQRSSIQMGKYPFWISSIGYDSYSIRESFIHNESKFCVYG